jgi:surfeit locus 1 family protein
MSLETRAIATPIAGGARWLHTSVLIVVVAALLALLLRLGFWQLERASYKDEIDRRFLQSEALPADPPARILETSGVQPWQFRHTRVEGEFDVHHQYLLDNRTQAGMAGYHVLTALRTPQGAVLVNRGWIGVGPDRARLPSLPLPDERVGITGRLVSPPADGLLLGDTGYESASWPKVVQTVDLEQMERHLGQELLPAMILLDSSHAACQLCDWQPVGGISADRHRGYAAQWFSLAAALLGLLAFSGWKGWRRAGR